jgi:pimeloyl-ACP methyl ester carboxylesterase
MALPILALTGLFNDERLWKNQVDALAGEHAFTVVPSVSSDSVAGLAKAALARAPAGRFVLAGFSLGGYVAFEVMRQAPERVAALVLTDTGARADTPEATEKRKAAIAAAKDPQGSNDVVASFLPRILHPDHLADTKIVGLLRSMGEAVGIDGFVRQQTAAMNRPDSRPGLSAITCPTLIICGRQDQTTPLELSEEMAAAIQGAKLVVIEHSGHRAPLEQPAAVTEALRNFLQSCAS